jgi:hypothetical protein
VASGSAAYRRNGFRGPLTSATFSLSNLYAAVHGRTEHSRTRTVESAAIRVEASRDNAERLALMLPGSDAPIAPTHWSFGQLAGLVGAPAAYLRQLPAPLAGINLQYSLTSHRAEQVKTLEIDVILHRSWDPLLLGFNVLNLRKKLETHLNFVCVLRDPKRASKLHRGFSQLCYLNEDFRFGAHSHYRGRQAEKRYR